MCRWFALALLATAVGCAQYQPMRSEAELAHSYVAMGFEHLQLDQRRPARASFREAIGLAPHHAQAYLGLAIVFERDGEVGLAEDYFLQALNIENQAAYAHAYAQFLVTQQRLDEAVEFFQSAASDVDYRGRAMAFEDLAMVQLSQGRWERAQFAFDRAARLDHTLPTPHWHLARMALASGDVERSYAHYSMLLNLIEDGVLDHTPQTLELGIELSMARSDVMMHESLQKQLEHFDPTQYR